MKEQTAAGRDPLAFGASLVLVALAFAGSYAHVVDAVRAAGQEGWFVYAIAAMAEITVALGMRRMATGQANALTWVTLVSSGAFTLAGNLASLYPHALPSVVVAVWPAYAAVLALALANVRHGPVAKPVASVAKPVAAPAKPVAKKVAAPAKPVAITVASPPPAAPEPEVAKPLATDPVVAWLREHWPTATGQLPGELAEQCAEATGVAARTVRRRAGQLRELAAAGALA